MRSRFILILFFIVWGILLSRIYFLSIKSNSYYEALAKQNMIKKEWIVPVRGEILDRYGKPLAVNNIGFKIKIVPHLKKREKLLGSIEKITAKFSDLNTSKLIKRYRKHDSPYNHDPIEVVPFISYERMMPYYTNLLLDPLIKIEPAFKRFYPQKEIASHVIGYVSKANTKDAQRDKVAKITGIIGKSGIEKYYNDYLEGELGYKKLKVTAFNRVIDIVEEKEPIQNRDLYLTLDLRLQEFIHKLFQNKAGVAIVMKTNGEILAAGSFPEFDPNLFVSGISRKKWKELISDLNHPFTNKLINGLYPPGSTIKMGVALSFLDSRKISPYTPFYCNGAIELGKRKFRCWKHTGHEEVRLIKAIRESCDVYFYEGSLRVGINKIAFDLRKMGFGKKSGVDLPNEFIGVVPDKEWKKRKYGLNWYQGETVVSSIGQGYDLVTPMQIARYTALLATGKLPTPHFARSFTYKNYIPKEEDVLTPLQKRNLKFIRRGMYEVCNHPKGTATRHISLPIKIAGKTGTAQIVGIPQDEKERMKEEELAYYSRSHAWLTTYAPFKQPRYIVTVLVEHGGHGGAAAGPIVNAIYTKMIELGYFRARD
ncbi:penicillin-binding protein 2 [Nitratiruptor sp. YY08-26]|uniref:penicillin-binding protein 2 n=1 Tax=unclassified Nitratiruptor TaxID=2624044 RepID=UPI0019151441|nr:MULTISPECIES: penicillin-binding protein 2 [unclassified Nitratiruptor]BCD62137.1 penicillin-binding protein 2 [Nitratiruptor sp. YY08-13]BCD66073.1 penicillin-binding protein 2 [Nitratiruptor sp. YY08-26]